MVKMTENHIETMRFALWRLHNKMREQISEADLQGNYKRRDSLEEDRKTVVEAEEWLQNNAQNLCSL